MIKGKDYIGVGAGALITDSAGTRVLLVKRKKAPEAGKWSIPGGAVEFGETFEACVVREVREETGLDINVVRLLRLTDHIVPEESVHWVTPAFLCQVVKGTARNTEPAKHEAVEWFSLEALPDALTMTTVRAVESYLAFEAGKEEIRTA